MKEFVKFGLNLDIKLWHCYPNWRKRWSCQLRLETVLGDFNARVGKESYLYPECGGHSLHNKSNVGGKWMV